MFAIRCTQTLLKRLAAHPDDADEREATSVLGDWYVNTLNSTRALRAMRIIHLNGRFPPDFAASNGAFRFILTLYAVGTTRLPPPCAAASNAAAAVAATPLTAG